MLQKEKTKIFIYKFVSLCLLISCLITLGCGNSESEKIDLSGPNEINEIDNFVYIPKGHFKMGDHFKEGLSSEQPAHSVYLSDYYIAKYEVTKALWDKVTTWAMNHGYDIQPESASGNGPDHPVFNVTYFECVKFANAYSEMKGLTPVYMSLVPFSKISEYGEKAIMRKWNENPYRILNANGYRLPTEAEWEKAARGGENSLRFPNGNTISHELANYQANSSAYEFDESATNGTHSDWTTNNNTACTSPVGSFPANGYGIHDMAGNLIEWCFDYYSDEYYEISPRRDPLGPRLAVRAGRIGRGGGWAESSWKCRVSYRGEFHAGREGVWFGFRLARNGRNVIEENEQIIDYNK